MAGAKTVASISFFYFLLLNYFVFVTHFLWSGYVIKLIGEDQNVWMFMLVVPEAVTYYQSDVFLGLFNNFADNDLFQRTYRRETNIIFSFWI